MADGASAPRSAQPWPRGSRWRRGCLSEVGSARLLRDATLFVRAGFQRASSVLPEVVEVARRTRCRQSSG
jgi:hypothetical protein